MDKKSTTQKKFNRIKGQINGIDKMLGEERDYLDVIQQFSAVRSALSALAIDMIRENSQKCFDCKDEQEKIQKFEQLVERFFKIA